MQFIKVSSSAPVINYLAGIIKDQLAKNKKVLWLVTGGSGIVVASGVSKNLASEKLANLSVALTDERFVQKDHQDSNWKQLQDAGFDLAGANLLPVLNNEDLPNTTNRYNDDLKNALTSADYKIGLIGMGPDGHIAALFPNLSEVHENNKFAISLNNSPKPPSVRITMTIPAIKMLDEAIIFAMGSEKRTMIENLKKDLSLDDQPAQILKLLPKLTIFNDQIGEEL
jgi:6-phosphogluconolactonase